MAGCDIWHVTDPTIEMTKLLVSSACRPVNSEHSSPPLSRVNTVELVTATVQRPHDNTEHLLLVTCYLLPTPRSARPVKRLSRQDPGDMLTARDCSQSCVYTLPSPAAGATHSEQTKAVICITTLPLCSWSTCEIQTGIIHYQISSVLQF